MGLAVLESFDGTGAAEVRASASPIERAMPVPVWRLPPTVAAKWAKRGAASAHPRQGNRVSPPAPRVEPRPRIEGTREGAARRHIPGAVQPRLICRFPERSRSLG